jgi:hypothetical protein
MDLLTTVWNYLTLFTQINLNTIFYYVFKLHERDTIQNLIVMSNF